MPDHIDDVIGIGAQGDGPSMLRIRVASALGMAVVHVLRDALWTRRRREGGRASWDEARHFITP